MILKDVRNNKIKTGFIVTGFFIIVALFIYFLSLWLLGNIYIAIFIGLTASFISAFASYYNSDKIILSINNARIATRDEYMQLSDILEGLCLATNLPIPKLYIIEDSAMNAFATGRNPSHSVICVTTGLINTLDKYELEGVLAHELSHIRNWDILLSTITIVMVGFIVILSDAFARGFIADRDDDNGSKVLMLIGFIFILLSPLFAELMKLAISRNREYLADSSAVEITRNKEGLISALKKIDSDTKTLDNVCKSSSSLFIINPLISERKKPNSIWSTHPTTESRIERLENIQ